MADCSGRCYRCCSSWESSVVADSRAFQSYALGKQCPCQLPLLPTGFEHSVLVTTEAPVWDNYTPTQIQAPVSPRPLATITLIAYEYTGHQKEGTWSVLPVLTVAITGTLPFRGSIKKRDAPFLRIILLDNASTPTGSGILILQVFRFIYSVTSPGHKSGIEISCPKAFMYVCMLSTYGWTDWFKFNFQLWKI